MQEQSIATRPYDKVKGLLPGLLTTLFIAGISFVTWWFLKGTWLKFSALLWAFIFSIIIVNLRPAFFEGAVKSGVDFSSTRLLRFAIAALGLTVNAAVWLKLGGAGIAMVLITLLIVFFFGLFFCRNILKLSHPLSLLISAGTAICGASAIAAVGPAVKAKAEEMGLSVAAITLFGLLAMFGYPLLYDGFLSGFLAGDPLAFGMWTGTGIHETAQVIAAASQVDNSLSIASSAKCIRIFMIGPMVIVSLLLFRRLSGREEKGQVKIAVPWFAVFFVIFTVVHYLLSSSGIGNSWNSFNSTWLSPIITFLLAWAFAGIGLKVKISTIRAMGLKAFFGGMAVSVFAGMASLLLVKYLWMTFN
ncbi:MAG: putative sulfate exporter family transporter [Dehalococcoidales bacterium]|nr:putative sulfate exporter family transporter [Dehalococcoidales bacterium]